MKKNVEIFIILKKIETTKKNYREENWIFLEKGTLENIFEKGKIGIFLENGKLEFLVKNGKIEKKFGKWEEYWIFLANGENFLENGKLKFFIFFLEIRSIGKWEN